MHKLKGVDLYGEAEWYYHNEKIDTWWEIISEAWKENRVKYFQYVKHKNVVVTAGAHIGMYTRFYSKEFKTVYAFEPDPLSFECLVNNVKENNVIKMQCALGNDNRVIELDRSGPHKHLTYKVGEPSEIDYIPMIKVDNLGLRACDLLQLDVEGYEYEIMKGAVETIAKFHPVIIAEKNLNGNIEKEILEFLTPLGYKFVDQTRHDNIWVKE